MSLLKLSKSEVANFAEGKSRTSMTSPFAVWTTGRRNQKVKRHDQSKRAEDYFSTPSHTL